MYITTKNLKKHHTMFKHISQSKYVPSHISYNPHILLQNCQKIFKKCVLGTTYIEICSACSNLQTHNSLLSVEKGLIWNYLYIFFYQILFIVLFLYRMKLWSNRPMLQSQGVFHLPMTHLLYLTRNSPSNSEALSFLITTRIVSSSFNFFFS